MLSALTTAALLMSAFVVAVSLALLMASLVELAREVRVYMANLYLE